MLRDFTRPVLWMAIWLFGIALCISLSLLPPIEMPGPQDSDKLGHALAYFTLSAWAMMLFRTRAAHVLVVLALFLLGSTIEFAQANFTTTRHGDIQDVYANTFGILVGLALSFTPLCRLLQRLDQRLSR